MSHRTLLLALFAGSFTPLALAGDDTHQTVAVVEGKEVPAPAIPMGDPATINAIIKEATTHCQVMDHLHYLTKEIGPRLTGSSNVERANNWAKSQYEAWGLKNVRLEQWGTIGVRFDRGPSTGKFFLRDDKKQDDGTVKTEYKEVRTPEFTTLAWSVGTSGPVRGVVVRQPKTEEEFAAIKDHLKGAWVLMEAPPGVGQRGVRRMAQEASAARTEARKKVAEGADLSTIAPRERVVFSDIAGFIATSRDERVWTGGAGGWRELDLDKMDKIPQVSIRLSDYDFLNSRIADGEPVEVEFNLDNRFTKGPIPVYNTLAEIPGTEKPDEYVIVSAHLDSWNGPGSEGCTDNGTGSATTLEAARLLAAVGARPKRTILFVDWTGEEQGLLGSKGFVDAHKDMLPKISAVFVDDGGTNYDGGLGCASVMVDYLAAATAPVNNVIKSEKDGKFLNCNIHSTGDKIESHGGSDHASFNAVGVPGFFWDETGRADYGFGWHTQNDKLDLAIPEYLQQSAMCAAITAYNLACAPDLLPRPEKKEVKADEKTGDDAKPPPPRRARRNAPAGDKPADAPAEKPANAPADKPVRPGV